MRELTELPDNLPIPIDDGACNHLCGMTIPSIELPSTSGENINLALIKSPRVIVYCYPMTAIPGQLPPDGWNLIPGARGCTPQACDFRDHQKELLNLGATVFGLSTQSTKDQLEASRRLHLEFLLLSDSKHEIVRALNLPTFEFECVRLVRRNILVIKSGKIEKVFYPVFPPNRSAELVIDWLVNNPI
ncbi:MAG: peroxiredoxin [Alphaproteobacteria bacterium]